ncbi:hypothetical protein [Microcoleus sp. FACHB-SPT15]|nr:hypothetical protein [Microcoleus sp. FACHB-SPT15]
MSTTESESLAYPVRSHSLTSLSRMMLLAHRQIVRKKNSSSC